MDATLKDATLKDTIIGSIPNGKFLKVKSFTGHSYGSPSLVEAAWTPPLKRLWPNRQPTAINKWGEGFLSFTEKSFKEMTERFKFQRAANDLLPLADTGHRQCSVLSARSERLAPRHQRISQQEVGSWKLEVGSWKLEVGSWKFRVNPLEGVASRRGVWSESRSAERCSLSNNLLKITLKNWSCWTV